MAERDKQENQRSSTNRPRERKKGKRRSGNRKRGGRLLWVGITLAAFLALLLVLILTAGDEEPMQAVPLEPIHTLPRNDFREEDFSEINGRMHYSGSYRQGIDVSEHQDEIDWAAVAEDGISFAMVRLGYRGTSEGGLFRDDRFHDHVVGAHGVGIETGAYFFSQAVSVDEALQEAELALEILDGYDMSYPIFYDWEVADTGRTAGVSYATVTECAKAFCQRLEEAGYSAGVYFNLSMSMQMRMRELEDYAFWVADYNSSPRYPYAFTFWQYTDKGQVSGIEGNVDLNLAFVEQRAELPTELPPTIEEQ